MSKKFRENIRVKSQGVEQEENTSPLPIGPKRLGVDG